MLSWEGLQVSSTPFAHGHTWEGTCMSHTHPLHMGTLGKVHACPTPFAHGHTWEGTCMSHASDLQGVIRNITHTHAHAHAHIQSLSWAYRTQTNSSTLFKIRILTNHTQCRSKILASIHNSSYCFHTQFLGVFRIK